MAWGRKSIADNLANSATIVALPETLKSLQDGQKELADAIAELGQRMRELEKDLEIANEKNKNAALKEAHSTVQSGLGSINQRMEDFAVRLALLENREGDMQQAKDVTRPRLVSNEDDAALDNEAGTSSGI